MARMLSSTVNKLGRYLRGKGLPEEVVDLTLQRLTHFEVEMGADDSESERIDDEGARELHVEEAPPRHRTSRRQGGSRSAAKTAPAPRR